MLYPQNGDRIVATDTVTSVHRFRQTYTSSSGKLVVGDTVSATDIWVDKIAITTVSRRISVSSEGPREHDMSVDSWKHIVYYTQCSKLHYFGLVYNFFKTYIYVFHNFFLLFSLPSLKVHPRAIDVTLLFVSSMSFIADFSLLFLFFLVPRIRFSCRAASYDRPSHTTSVM